MAKDSRGTKRTCQNDDCEAKFYDLNRDPIVCPTCGSVYKLAKAAAVAPAAAVVAAAPVKSVIDPALSTDGDEIADVDEALISLEDADAELGGDEEDDDVFLADDDDEDGNGVGAIIGGGVEADEDEI